MRYRTATVLVTACSAALWACSFVPLNRVDTLDMRGDNIPLRAAYWVPPEFLSLDGRFYPFMEAAGCGLARVCVDQSRVFPIGIGAVARAVFAETREVSTQDTAFADPNTDVVMAPEISGISVWGVVGITAQGEYSQPLMIRITWRIWTKDHSLVWLDTITSAVDSHSMTSYNRNGRAIAFNQCVRDQFQRAANAMRTGNWWEALTQRDRSPALPSR